MNNLLTMYGSNFYQIDTSKNTEWFLEDLKQKKKMGSEEFKNYVNDIFSWYKKLILKSIIYVLITLIFTLALVALIVASQQVESLNSWTTGLGFALIFGVLLFIIAFKFMLYNSFGKKYMECEIIQRILKLNNIIPREWQYSSYKIYKGLLSIKIKSVCL